MEIRRFNPSPQLAKFVRCYYYIENGRDVVINDTFFADGCMEAVFSLGWEFYKDGTKEDWAKVIGQITKPRRLNITGKGQSFGIWFHPHTFSYLSKVPAFELNDRVLPWDALFPESFAEFVGNCIYERRFDELVRGVESFLSKKISAHKEQALDRLTDAAVHYMCEHKWHTDLHHLASRLNVSTRLLQKAFLNKIGVSQKQFLRILRFQQVLESLRRPGLPNLTVMAYAHDFYDQSHFIREFKAFTGVAPSHFELAKLPINQHFIAAS